MQVVIALIAMGVTGAVATLLVATAALIQLAPLLIAALVVAGVGHWLWRRRRRRAALSSRFVRPGRPRWSPPALPGLDGWALIAVWERPEKRGPHRPAVVEAEIFSVEDHRG